MEKTKPKCVWVQTHHAVYWLNGFSTLRWWRLKGSRKRLASVWRAGKRVSAAASEPELCRGSAGTQPVSWDTRVPLECRRAPCTQPWRLSASLVTVLVLFIIFEEQKCRFVFFSFFKWYWIHLGSCIPSWKLFFLCQCNFANIFRFLQCCGL